jgi:hypothetical protein
VTGRGIDQDLADAIKHLRDVGIVPWNWITDETRAVYLYTGYPTVLEGTRALLDGVHFHPWGDQPAPLILTESRSLAGVLYPIAADYRCPIAATNGQVGGFLHTEIAPLLDGGRRVLYFGDWDWQGHQIETNTRRVLRGYARLEWERVALTETQVNELIRLRYGGDRSRLVVKKKDHRYRPPAIHDAVETEAYGQRRIASTLRARLDQLLPEPLADVLVREQREREELAAKLREWQG